MNRNQLAAQYDDNWFDIIEEAHKEKVSLTKKLQDLSPSKEFESESDNALYSMLEHEGIYLQDSPKHGIQSSSMKDIFKKEHVAFAWTQALKTHTLTRFRGFDSLKAIELQVSQGDFVPGSPFRQWTQAPLRDGKKLMAWPPLSAVAASVITQDGDSIQLPEYTNDPSDEARSKWKPPAPIPLGTLGLSDTSITAKWLAGGFYIADDLRNSSSFTSQAAMLRMEKDAIRMERVIAKELLVKISADAGTAIELGADYNADTVIQIAQTFKKDQEDYQITTLLGNEATVRSYMGIDRSGFAYNSGGMTPAGAMVGTDSYGDVAANRMVYDVETDPNAEAFVINIADDNLLALDASEAADVYLVTGSDRTTDEFIARRRVHEVAITLKYATTLRVPTGTKPIKLFSYT